MSWCAKLTFYSVPSFRRLLDVGVIVSLIYMDAVYVRHKDIKPASLLYEKELSSKRSPSKIPWSSIRPRAYQASILAQGRGGGRDGGCERGREAKVNHWGRYGRQS